MAGIFNEIVLNWSDQEYRITPTMALMNQIESRNISLSNVAYMVSDGRPPFAHIATVIAILLNAAGAKVSDEDVYAEITSIDVDTLTQYVGAILSAAFPVKAKKATAPAKAKGKS